MSESRNSASRSAGSAPANAEKRVILSMGGKGGVGKTGVMAGLAEWFDANQIPVKLLDLDTENKARGSLTHFFAGRVPKVNIHTPAGLDFFVDHLADGEPIILADMGAGSGQVTSDWFEKMYPDVSRRRNRLHHGRSSNGRSSKRRERPCLGGMASESGRIPDRRK